MDRQYDLKGSLCKASFALLIVLTGVFWLPPTAQAQESLCAEVQIEISQELTLERQAFEAHMRINNGISHITLENVAVTVNFTDEEGNPVEASSNPDSPTATFFIRVDEMQNIGAVDGTGTVQPSSSADIYWLIIPSPGASDGIPQGKMYYVGATLTYTISGEEHVTKVSPDYIFVKPMPLLYIDYFLPGEVYGDDAFTTDVVEPPIPFSLGVRVSNRGAGIARQLTIESAQPKIVRNDQDLLINFVIEGSEVNGQPATPGLLVDFGDIPSNTSGVARWFMTCSLSGHFDGEGFTAEFSHADELGGELTSLIEEVNTHLLVRDVLVDLPGRDSIRDFLITDRVDPGLTYHIFESENTESEMTDRSDVSDLTPVVGQETIYILSTPVTPGFLYVSRPMPDELSVPDTWPWPVSAVRSDGKVIKPENVWISKVRKENPEEGWNYVVNLFDVNATDTYTLIFEDVAFENHPPALQVIADQTGTEEQQIAFPVEASDPDGTIPTLSAAPLPAGATFTDHEDGTGTFDWTPSAGQAGTYSITFSASDGELTDSQPVTISVAPASGYMITASAGSGGTISPAGVIVLNAGEDQSFTITPEAHYHIADVLVDGSSEGAQETHTFTNVTANHTIEAVFALDTYRITATPGANGSITPSGTVTVEHGANQSFTITPDEGYHITAVRVDGEPVDFQEFYDDNNFVIGGSVLFYTVNADHTIEASFASTGTPTVSVRLRDSTGNGLAGGIVSWRVGYSGAWQDLPGSTDHEGVLPVADDTFAQLTESQRASLNFRMEYGAAGERLSKIQNIAADPVVVFETTAVTLELRDSQGIPITEGMLWHYRVGYSGDWQPVSSPLEVLPIANLNVRVSYGAAGERLSKIQDIAADPAVVFTTTAVTLELRDSQGTPITEGVSWEYRVGYSGSWQAISSPVELLPISNLNVRVTYGVAGETLSKVQNIVADPVVIFETTAVTLELRNSQGTPITEGVSWEYRVGYSGAWQAVSSPVELLPISNLNVRVSYGTAGETMSKVQDIAADPVVVFETTSLTVIKAGSGSGSVIVNGQVCDATCQQLSVPFTEQTVVTLEAIPESGSYFVRWENDAGEPLEGIVYENTDVTISAVFEITN